MWGLPGTQGDQEKTVLKVLLDSLVHLAYLGRRVIRGPVVSLERWVLKVQEEKKARKARRDLQDYKGKRVNKDLPAQVVQMVLWDHQVKEVQGAQWVNPVRRV